MCNSIKGETLFYCILCSMTSLRDANMKRVSKRHKKEIYFSLNKKQRAYIDLCNCLSTLSLRRSSRKPYIALFASSPMSPIRRIIALSVTSSGMNCAQVQHFRCRLSSLTILVCLVTCHVESTVIRSTRTSRVHCKRDRESERMSERL